MNTLSGGLNGRVKAATAFGVLALAALIAVFGILPAIGATVEPVVVSYGGGFGACSATIEGRLPSAAGNEFHINNPTPGSTYTQDGITVTVSSVSAGAVFDFEVAGGSEYVVYDVIVNGGPKNNHYDYDGDGSGPVKSDTLLHAPNKNASKYHNLSHINICYDIPGLVFLACDDPQTLTGIGLITEVTAEIFANSAHACVTKQATYALQDEVVTLRFEGDGDQTAVGRLDFTKDFGTRPPIPDLQYDRDDSGPAGFVDVQWCTFRAKASGDGSQFDVELGSTTLYPSLDGVTDTDLVQATSCKVFESESVIGIQHTVVYFQLDDPQWR